MDYVDRVIDEADAVLKTATEYFIAVRQDGFAEAVNGNASEYAGLKKSELERLRHEHRAKRNNIGLVIENEKAVFRGAYIMFYRAIGLWPPLFMILIFAIIMAFNSMPFTKWFLPLAISLFIVDLAVWRLMHSLMQKTVGRLLEEYALYGAAEGMISLSDYRKLETIELSRLPNESYASQEVEW